MRNRVKLSFSNETTDTLLFSLQDKDSPANTAVPLAPNTSVTTPDVQANATVHVSLCTAEKTYDLPSSRAETVFRLHIGAKWTVDALPRDCPWRIYRTKVSKGHYKLAVFPHRNLASFLSEMPDTLPLSSLLLPGTHDTMAFYGWPVSQCQDLRTPLAAQLQGGIRVLDIRLAVIDGCLIAYHGIYPQRTPFQDILRDVHDFLAAPATCHEALVMSLKQEDFAKTPLPLFSRLVHDEIMSGPGGRDMWFLENRIPRLGEVRGKVVMLSRFGGDGSEWEGGLEGLGIHPTAWPDSEKDGFTWTLKGTLVRTHDWYAIPSFLAIPEKTALATAMLLLPPPDAPPFPGPVLNVSYFSAASFPLAFPPTIARGFGWPKWGLGVEGVNARLGKWLLEQFSQKREDARIRGWAFLDFYAEPDDVVPLLVECNFRGRKPGEEGWE